MALKSVDDVNVSGFDDELSTTEIVYFAKNFRNFLRNNNKRSRGKNNAEPRNLGGMIQLRLITLKNLKGK